jgi:hypothetical protein
MRETKAIQFLKPPKQIALFCGPKLYQPDTEKKGTALACYRQIVDALDPQDTAITRPRLWHDDLHDENVFVDPHNPEKITGIIDWQSCHISPLFNHNPDPAFLDLDGLEPETLDLAPRPTPPGFRQRHAPRPYMNMQPETCLLAGGNSCKLKTQICIEQWSFERQQRMGQYFFPTECLNTARHTSIRFWPI